MILKDKNIVLGVTGSIAAYKAATLIRLLVKKGANVRVIMTPLSKAFITPLTLATLSKNPIWVDFYNPENGDWNSHVSMGLWADLMVIAPATANTIAKMANGIADNLLLTTYLSAKCPILVAPAMDLDMYQHPTTQRNIETLQKFGNTIVEAEDGELASGLCGKGRMAEPEHIIQYIKDIFSKDGDFANKHVLITAGPTYEQIDPVRFIGNRSSGKMGFALAEEFANRGAKVTIVSGPVKLQTVSSRITRVDVESAAEMYDQTITAAEHCDIVVSCAAVADFTPTQCDSQKIKRGHDDLTITLNPTRDIAAELGRRKHNGQILVGFALETNDEKTHAIEKLHRKNLDLIVLNSLQDAGAGFGVDTNKITIFDKDETTTVYPLKSKKEVASDIVDRIAAFIDR